MSTSTGIEWTDATWNPTEGCTMAKGSETGGCLNCYAARTALRRPAAGLSVMRSTGPRWTGKVQLVESRLEIPLHWKKPRRVFVNSMSDLFHESLSDEAIDRVFAVMALCPQHTCQILTKRPERMLEYASAVTFKRLVSWMNKSADGGEHRPEAYSLTSLSHRSKKGTRHEFKRVPEPPFPNVWLGVSVENQATADERIPLLLQTPAAVRFVSYEPALGPVNFSRWLQRGELESLPLGGAQVRRALHWIIVGGESGPGARPFDIQWARNTVEQCRAAGVPVFVKQLGAKIIGSQVDFAPYSRAWHMDDGSFGLNDRKGGDWDEWPEDLRVRQFPEDRQRMTGISPAPAGGKAK